MVLSKDNLFRGSWIYGNDFDYGLDDAGYYQNNHNAVLIKQFEVKDFKEASFYIAALGYYILKINGKRVGDYELNSDWTDYQKIVYYDEYDISSYLKDGTNYLEIELGNGMYNPSPLKLFGKYNLREKLAEVGTPKIICDLEADGEIIIRSDSSWEYVNGQFLFNNLYLGETVDFNYHDPIKKPVSTVCDHRNYQPSFIPKVRRIKAVKDYELAETANGLMVDFHEMISGFIKISFKSAKGTEVTIRYSEFKNGDELEFESSYAGSVGMVIEGHNITGGPGAPDKGIQTDVIIANEGVNEFENKFTYHSFRYALIEGLGSDDIISLEAIYVHTDLKYTGKVNSEHEYYNDLYDAAIRTKLNNVHSVFEDCTRERLGYGGDIVALALSNLYAFDVEAMFKKTIIDFRIEQTENGGLPETAPFMGIGSNGTAYGEGPLLWQFVYPYLIVKNYQFYGDRETLANEYPYYLKLVDYLLSFNLDELATRCLGDHGSVLTAGSFKTSTPDKLFTGYCTILMFVEYLIKMQHVLEIDSHEYQGKYDRIKDAITSKFQNSDGSFGDATQTSYAFAIEANLGDIENLVNQLVGKIETDDYVINAGIFGMAFIYDILNKHHFDEVIDKWLNREEAPSFKNMLAKGSKVLEEQFFNKYSSYNHAMFSSYVQWYYQGLGGIRVEQDAIGCDSVSICPYFSKWVNDYECSFDSRQGMFRVAWQRTGDYVECTIDLPEGLNNCRINIGARYEVVKENHSTTRHAYVIKD